MFVLNSVPLLVAGLPVPIWFVSCNAPPSSTNCSVGTSALLSTESTPPLIVNVVPGMLSSQLLPLVNVNVPLPFMARLPLPA